MAMKAKQSTMIETDFHELIRLNSEKFSVG